ncbi:hypothetical protein, partial [Enterobacter kobei]
AGYWFGHRTLSIAVNPLRIEGKKKRPGISAASNDLYLSFPRRLIHGEKKPAQRNGQKVGILGSNKRKRT